MSFKDWGEVAFILDEVVQTVNSVEITKSSEAETRFKIIDRIIREVFQWKDGQVSVEEREIESEKYIDYILRNKDYSIVIEAKKLGASFPSFTKQKKLRLSGQILGTGEVSKAIKQAEGYADSLNANLVVVSNGSCWIVFKPINYRIEQNEYASIFFPLENPLDCEKLFRSPMAPFP